MADDTDKSDNTDDEGKSGNETPFGSKSKHHKGKVIFVDFQATLFYISDGLIIFFDE